MGGELSDNIQTFFSPPLAAFETVLAQTAVSLTANLDVSQTCDAILNAVERLFAAATSWILLHDPRGNDLVTCATRGPRADVYRGARIPSDGGVAGAALRQREPLFVPDAQIETRWFDTKRVRVSGLRSVLMVPLAYGDQTVGVFGIESPRFTAASPPSVIDVSRVRAIAALAAVGLNNARLFEAAETERRRLERVLRERRELRDTVATLRAEVRAATSHTSLVGASEPLNHVLALIDLVAPADSTVLIVGETGTGKELVARTIHERSRRRTAAFIAVNCGALPESLVESELFGHEKGAFTGADARRLGKFELANRGTLFLDEIGEMPLPAQVKLLRVLQEREVQRLGGHDPVPINVRVIAATNHDLDASVRDGRFRADLFYRLSVFPIAVPPLRHRTADIPALAQHFAYAFASRQHTRTPTFTTAALEQLTTYVWPGNVRELQNVVERAVILSRGGDIAPDLLTFPVTAPPPAAAPDVTTTPSEASSLSFSDAERKAILQVIVLTGWRISGPNGAASVLGLKPTTLHAKMKKLGIRRPSAGRR